MNKNMAGKIAVAVFGVILVVLALVGIYVWGAVRVDFTGIKKIEQAQIGKNKFADYGKQINVEGPNDIGFIVKSDYNIEIHYGSIILHMNKNCFESEEWNRRLKGIGIEVKTHANDDGTILYRVTYWDEVVDEYSRID